MLRIRAIAWVMILVGVCATSATRVVAEDTLPEYSIKAAFLRQFLNFVEWPDSVLGDNDNEIRIGIIGGDPFGKALSDAFAENQADPRRYPIVHARTVDDALRCHVLFVAAPRKSEVMRILEAARTRPILTVGEKPYFNEYGGIIRFSLEDDRVRFTIDRDNAERVGIQMSSKLLTLSRGGR